MTSLNDAWQQSQTWNPIGDGAPRTIYVVHVDVPPRVVVESRNEFFYDVGIPELFPSALGNDAADRASAHAGQRSAGLSRHGPRRSRIVAQNTRF